MRFILTIHPKENALDARRSCLSIYFLKTARGDGKTPTLIAAVAEAKCTRNGLTKTKKVIMKNAVHIIIEGKQAEILFPDSLLRDYFAGQALVGDLAGFTLQESECYIPQNVAERAYKYADAMLAARNAKLEAAK
jgi:hypothetical protein